MESTPQRGGKRFTNQLTVKNTFVHVAGAQGGQDALDARRLRMRASSDPNLPTAGAAHSQAASKAGEASPKGATGACIESGAGGADSVEFELRNLDDEIATDEENVPEPLRCYRHIQADTPEELCIKGLEEEDEDLGETSFAKCVAEPASVSYKAASCTSLAPTAMRLKTWREGSPSSWSNRSSPKAASSPRVLGIATPDSWERGSAADAADTDGAAGGDGQGSAAGSGGAGAAAASAGAVEDDEDEQKQSTNHLEEKEKEKEREKEKKREKVKEDVEEASAASASSQSKNADDAKNARHFLESERRRLELERGRLGELHQQLVERFAGVSASKEGSRQHSRPESAGLVVPTVPHRPGLVVPTADEERRPAERAERERRPQRRQQQQPPPQQPLPRGGDARAARQSGLHGLYEHVPTRAPEARLAGGAPTAASIPLPLAMVPESERTTLMVRNLPNSYNRASLLQTIHKEGFERLYDFVYIPIDFGSGQSLGYAFLNFVTNGAACKFKAVFQNFDRWSVSSKKTCSVGWCDPYQGLQANVERYRNSPVMHAVVPDEYKPQIYDEGVPVPFPAATKKLRAPRVRGFRERDPPQQQVDFVRLAMGGWFGRH